MSGWIIFRFGYWCRPRLHWDYSHAEIWVGHIFSTVKRKVYVTHLTQQHQIHDNLCLHALAQQSDTSDHMAAKQHQQHKQPQHHSLHTKSNHTNQPKQQKWKKKINCLASEETEPFAYSSPELLQPPGRCYMNKQEPKHFCFIGRKLKCLLLALSLFIIMQNMTFCLLWSMARWRRKPQCFQLLPEFPVYSLIRI